MMYKKQSAYAMCSYVISRANINKSACVCVFTTYMYNVVYNYIVIDFKRICIPFRSGHGKKTKKLYFIFPMK